MTGVQTCALPICLQHTPVGGQVSVNLDQSRRQNQTAIHVTVQDTGVGIPPEALPYIFDRFYRADPARQRSGAMGSGLGLAIAKVIVENHDGTIDLKSTPDEGTEVTVRLPLQAEVSSR